MKYSLLALLFLFGCSTSIPIRPTFPEPSTDMMLSCSPLNKLEKDSKLSDVARTVTLNYTLYHECSIKNDAWIEWYKAQKKIFEDIK